MKKNLYIIIIAVIFAVILWISISLSTSYYTTVKVPVKIINLPEGYTTASKYSKYISMKLKGKGWKLVSLTWGNEEDYTISAARDSGKKSVVVSNYLIENQWLSSDVEVIDINPDTLTFYVEEISSTKARIIPDLNLGFKPGYGLASKITISPESTIVYGPESKIEGLSAIPTERINFNDLDDKVQEKIKLASIPGLSYQHNIINLTMDVQKIVEKNIENVDVSAVDIPADRDVVLIPGKIEVGLRGGVDILAELSSDDLKASVNYRDVVLDTVGSVAPQVHVPKNTTLIYIKPERLRYIIKKFNN